MDIRKPAALLWFVVFALCAGVTVDSFAQEARDPLGTAKLRLAMKEPMATNLHVSVIETGACKSISDLWVTGGVKRFYANRVGMLDASPVREGIVELEVPANTPIGIPTNMHVAKLGWGEILFATNPAQQDSIRGKQPTTCEVPVFTPRSGGQYEIVFEGGPGFCRVVVAELNGTDGAVVRTEVAGNSTLAVRKVGRKKYACGAQ